MAITKGAKKSGRKTLSPWDAYVEDVLAGKVPVGRWVKLACERHRRDIKRQRTESFPFYFSIQRAQRIIDFFDYLHHSKGKWEKQTFKLEPWQQFVLASVFGWLQWNGTKADPENDA